MGNQESQVAKSNSDAGTKSQIYELRNFLNTVLFPDSSENMVAFTLPQCFSSSTFLHQI